jgi:2'-hydroxyisoflavone reductase
MDIVVLGGTQFVGRAFIEAALNQGHQVTAINRGTKPVPPGALQVSADRLHPGQLREALATLGSWDLALDTWSFEPRRVTEAAQLLRGRVGRYAYVSSRSVYQWPISAQATESAPCVAGDPDAGATDYAADKRGGELGVLREFGDRALLLRPGLILGPYENIGRLAYWLERAAAGGVALAPGHSSQVLQYIDARDLGQFILHAATTNLSGIFDTVSRPGHTTMGELLSSVAETTGGKVDWRWVNEDIVTGWGLTGWVDLPIWVPEHSELSCLHNGDTTKAHGAGLVCRPISETARDTWQWLQDDPPGILREPYLLRSAEQQFLASVAG